MRAAYHFLTCFASLRAGFAVDAVHAPISKTTTIQG